MWLCSATTGFTGPRDDVDVGVGRTEMTAPSVVGDELAFLRQVRRVLASQRLEYQGDSLYSTRHHTGNQ